MHITSDWLPLIVVQDFINNLLDECARCGITDIGPEVPETVWHQGGQTSVEDTLRHAVDLGQKMFGIKPALILILLPGNGALLTQYCTVSVSDCDSVQPMLVLLVLLLENPSATSGTLVHYDICGPAETLLSACLRTLVQLLQQTHHCSCDAQQHQAVSLQFTVLECSTSQWLN